MQGKLNAPHDEVPAEDMQREPLFSVWRILALIVTGMIIFNIVMSIFTDTLLDANVWKSMMEILSISIAGLLMTPAPFGLTAYALIMETLYNTRAIKNYWLFCLMGGIVGVGTYIGVFFVLGANITKDYDGQMLAAMFITHILTALVVYRKKRNDKDGGSFSRQTSFED